MIFSFLYESLLATAALIMLPKVIYQAVFRKKYRKSIKQRFGMGFSAIKRGEKPLIWLHAVSVGETKAAEKVALKLKEILNADLLVSSVTETGHEEAKKTLPFASWHVYMPLDFYWNIAPIVSRLKPDVVIVVETDLWFNFLKTAKKFGAKTYLINGKISEKSAARLKRASFFSNRLLSCVDVFCVQNEMYKHRFLQLGVMPEKIHTTGNLKFDNNLPRLEDSEIQKFKASLQIKAGEKVIVIGSSHDPEEKEFLTILTTIWDKYENVKVALVPRHPERFDAVASLLASENISFLRYSKRQEVMSAPVRVILIDSMGLLGKCYQIADVAIVAGSYTKNVGGHNILEPLWFGVPTIFGPEMHSQQELAAVVNRYKAAVQAPLSTLEETLTSLLFDDEKKEELKKCAEKLIRDMQGTAKRTLSILQ